MLKAKPHRHPCGMPPVRVAAPSVHIVQSTRVLLAAAPTTPPCFRHWRRSSSLPSRGGLGKEAELFAMPRAPLLAGAVAARRLGGSAVSSWWSQTPPSSLRDATVRVAAPRVRFVQSFALASCWPLPQQLLPVSAAGGGRRRCLVGAALAKRQSFAPCQGPPY